VFTPHCSPRATSFPTLVNLFYDVRFRSYGTPIYPEFRIFAYFPIHNKQYLAVISRQPRCCIAFAECLRLFPVVVEGSNGCLLLVGFRAISGRGAMEPKICPNFRLREMPVYNARRVCRTVRHCDRIGTSVVDCC